METRPSGLSKRGPRRDDGVALVEFALVFLFLAIMVFGVIDLSRGWQLQNRMANAAREAAAHVELSPRSIDSGCDGTRNAYDRASGEDPSLEDIPGFDVEVVKVTGSGEEAVTPGCGAANNLSRGDTARVRVTAEMDILTPLIGAITGDPILVTKTVDVVVQGQ